MISEKGHALLTGEGGGGGGREIRYKLPGPGSPEGGLGPECNVCLMILAVRPYWG